MTSNSSSPVVTGWSGRVRCAFGGLGLVFRSQASAQLQAMAGVAVIGLGVALGVSAIEWCALVLAMSLVLTAEALNTSIEAIVDLVSPDLHPLAGRAKDVAAGAVLIGALASVAIGLLVFGPHVWPWLRG